MNLRQKCKKYKQRIETLERMALPTRTAFYTSETLNHLRASRNIPETLDIPRNKEYFEDVMREQITEDAGKILKDYIIFDYRKGTVTLDVWLKKKEKTNEVQTIKHVHEAD